MYDRTTLRHCFQYEGSHERGSRADRIKDKIEESRALPQRTPALCTEFAWVEKLDDIIHVTVDADWAGDPKTRCSTSGGVLAIGPCFAVRHWSETEATVSLSSAESEAKATAKGCIEALCVKHLQEHQTKRLFKIEVWTDSSSAKAIMQRLSRAESKTLGGTDDVGSTVGQDRSHLAEQVEYAGKCGRSADKTCSKNSTRQAGRNDGFHISW